jgi:hypothetical protein
MELYARGSYAFLLHEEISPFGWRRFLLFALGLVIFVKLVDELARLAEKGSTGAPTGVAFRT